MENYYDTNKIYQIEDIKIPDFAFILLSSKRRWGKSVICKNLLKKIDYQGFIICDDIWYFKEMRNNFWYKIGMGLKKLGAKYNYDFKDDFKEVFFLIKHGIWR